MDLTFIHVRKPQEAFEKGSKGTGRRRGLPAPLYPAPLFKPLQGPFPRGTEVPGGQEGRRTRVEEIANRGDRAGQADHPPTHTPTTPGCSGRIPEGTPSEMHNDHPAPPVPGNGLLPPPSPYPLSPPSFPNSQPHRCVGLLTRPPPRPRKIRLPAPRPAARASQTAASAAPFRLFCSGSRPRPASRLPAP